MFFSREYYNINIKCDEKSQLMLLSFFLGKRGVTLTLLCKFKLMISN